MFEYMVAGLVTGAFFMLFVGLALAHVIIQVLLIPRENIMAAVIALAAIGAYASKLQYGDVWMMVAFGAVAYVLRRLDFPLAPLVLGLVLGRMFDDFLRTALIISDGSLAPLWQRPICLVLVVVLIGFFLLSTPAAHRLLGRVIGLPASAGRTDE
jgi:putative tricarboxylic transport membrane protein